MVTKEEIQKIAMLSKLSVLEEELEALTDDMQQIIAFADTINAAVDELGDYDSVGTLKNAFREDVVVPSYPQERILANVDGGEDGLDFYRVIAEKWLPFLQTGSLAAVETGEGQPPLVEKLFSRALTGLQILPDCYGTDRFVCGQKGDN